jgi:AcrR family transcriptional regulator
MMAARSRGELSRLERAGEHARTRAVESAGALFARQGADKTSIAQIAADARLSQSGLLHHFPTKDRIIAAVLDRWDQESSVLLRDDDGHRLTGWAMFDGLRCLLERHTVSPERMAVYVHISAEARLDGNPLRSWLVRHYRDISSVIAAAIRQGQVDGTWSADAPSEEIAQVTVAVMDGLQERWLLANPQGNPDPEAEPFDMVAAFDTYLKTLRRSWGRG